MSLAPKQQTAITTKLELVHTQLGFDLLVDPTDYLSSLLMRDGIFEAPETDLVARIVHAGDTCIDAGCHLGYYSCLVAQLAGETGLVYSFDANPQACQSTRRNLALNGSYSAEVIHAALADQNGNRPFHISTDDQTGLSSLGAIPVCKQTISVPCLRLEAFLDERRVNKIRLLKIDVEGAEEIVLRGLGHYVPDHVIDFILIECFDERLQSLSTSTATIAGILKSAGYSCWEFGRENPSGWSQTSEVRSRGDCNYLFSSPAVSEKMPRFSLAAALAWTQAQRDQLLNENNRLQNQMQNENNRLQYQSDRLQDQRDQLLNEKEKLQDDADWLLSSIKTHEEQAAQLAAEKRELEMSWEQLGNSASWRMLNKWRRVRGRLVPDNTRRRRFYDSILNNFRGKA